MKDAVWYLLITAIAIPIGGSIVSYVNARLSRTTAQETALLAARQRRRDAEIAQMRDALSDLQEAATAVQSFTWFADREFRLRHTSEREDFEKHGELIERAVVGAQRLRALARTAPTDGLNRSYNAVERLIMKVVMGSDDPDAPDAWNEDVSGPQPDTITRAVNATADQIKRLYETYPTELSSSRKLARRACGDALSS